MRLFVACVRLLSSDSRFTASARLGWSALLFLWLTAIVSLPSGAQVENPGFTRLTVEQGLPRATVYSIFQDSREFLWIGTTGGLCRYDGYTFKVHDELYFNGESIILEDSRGWLWYDPAGELHRLDPATNKVTRYRIGLGTRTYRLLKDRSGDIWAATLGDGLGRYVPSADTFEVFTHQEGNPRSLASDTVYAIYEDSRGVLWVTSRGGLQKFDREKNAFTPAEWVGHISAICEGVNHELWLGTDSGLWRLDPSTGTCDRFRNTELGRSSVLSIFLTREHELWVATADRIVRFDGEKKQFKIVKTADPKVQLRPDGFPLNHFYEDRQGRLWVSTSAGLALYNRRTDLLEPFRGDRMAHTW